MSRSYKKNPVSKDRSPWNKNQANRKIRRSKDVPDGCQYKRYYPQWDICEWWSREPKTQWLKDIHSEYRGYLKCSKVVCHRDSNGNPYYYGVQNPLRRKWATVDYWEKCYLRK